MMHHPDSNTSRTRANKAKPLLEELEKLDREAGHDYVPMDLFIDPETMKEHFQASSIRARLKRTR